MTDITGPTKIAVGILVAVTGFTFWQYQANSWAGYVTNDAHKQARHLQVECEEFKQCDSLNVVTNAMKQIGGIPLPKK